MKPKKSGKESPIRWQNFFIEELRDLYRSEKRWMIILPEVARKMPARAVEAAVVKHLEQTVAKVIQMEVIFESVAAMSQEESRAIKPLLLEAGEVLTAVTRSTAAVREKTAGRSFVPEGVAENPFANLRN